ncbi:MAG: TatD family hydrolase [Kiritimatiellia bacterium]|jgi:TatD DNase family protein
MLFDAHLHLQDSRFPVKHGGASPDFRLLRLAADAGVAGCCCCATSPGDWDATLAWKGEWEIRPESFFRVEVALGVHPWWSAEAPTGWAGRLEAALAAHPEAIVGEAGLDGLRDVPMALQREALDEQLALAARLGRGIVLHGARAWGALADAVRPYAARLPFLVCHAFGGSCETMREWLGMGAFLSFGGAVCNPRARTARAACAACPADRLLFETDSPDLFPVGGTPCPFADNGGKPLNHPGNLPLVARSAAELRGVPVDELTAIVLGNSRKIF